MNFSVVISYFEIYQLVGVSVVDDQNKILGKFFCSFNCDPHLLTRAILQFAKLLQYGKSIW